MTIQNMILTSKPSILLGLFSSLICSLSVLQAADLVSTPQASSVSLENAVWEVFTDRSGIAALLLSDEGETLWVGTIAGLEQRHPETGDVKRIFTHLDGLPNNAISALANDGQGGIWVGTDNTDLTSLNNVAASSGLAHYHSDGTWEIFNTHNADLPSDNILSLHVDNQQGVWVGTTKGLAYRHADGTWQRFEHEHSELPDIYWATSLVGDNQGGIWMGAWMGKSTLLAHRHADGTWEIFNSDNAQLPESYINSLLNDGKGGLWVATADLWFQNTSGGLAHQNAEGTWEIFNTHNSELPDNRVLSLVDDEQGGLWIATYGGLVHRQADGTWEVFNQINSVIPGNYVFSLSSDGQNGIWLGTILSGLAHRHRDGNWDIFNKDASQSPGNQITSILEDGRGGLWMGTRTKGLAHRQADTTWRIFNWQNSALPDIDVTSLLSDNRGGLWIGTVTGGLAHRSQNGTWEKFNTVNSGLPYQGITSLIADGQGGIWVGTGTSIESDSLGKMGGGLAHRHANGNWAVFNQDNSPLPYNDIRSLLADEQGGIWIGTGSVLAQTPGGLAHFHTDGTWDIFNQDNSPLPGSWITSLLADGSDGIWIGMGSQIIEEKIIEEMKTGGGLVHYQMSQGTWTVFNTDNSPLPNNDVRTLFPDGSGGIWIGTRGGLVHRDAEKTWKIFNTTNSGLPVNDIRSLFATNGELWVGTWGSGLAHLTFGQKSHLCTINESDCETILSKNAAIIIAGGGADEDNALWDTTAAISDSIYKMLNERGFDHDEIDYLSPQSYADFNGDGRDDCIVDAPATPRCRINSVDNSIPERDITVDDIRNTLTWAKSKGQLEQPLYLFFINHGGPDKFQLANGRYLDVFEFKTILDDYQNETGNQLVLVIDACYSGVLLEKLIAPNRAIISSTGNGLAYFDRKTKQGFSRFLAKALLKGMNFSEAFDSASGEQSKLLVSQNIDQEQIPQWHDGKEGEWLRALSINGSFVTGDTTLAIESQSHSKTLSAGQSVQLQAQASLAQGTIKRVWAVLKPPKVNLIIDTNGTPILGFPHLNLHRSFNENVWETTWHNAVYNGDYEITFYAEDNESNIASSDNTVIISVTGGVAPPEQASVQIMLEKDRYRPGEHFKAEVIENLGWGYDLYIALVLPDGQFLTFNKTNQPAINEVKKWREQRIPARTKTLIDFTWPLGLPKGEYCFYGILSPEQENVLKTLAQNLWVWEQQCFEIF